MAERLWREVPPLRHVAPGSAKRRHVADTPAQGSALLGPPAPLSRMERFASLRLGKAGEPSAAARSRPDEEAVSREPTEREELSGHEDDVAALVMRGEEPPPEAAATVAAVEERQGAGAALWHSLNADAISSISALLSPGDLMALGAVSSDFLRIFRHTIRTLSLSQHAVRSAGLDTVLRSLSRRAVGRVALRLPGLPVDAARLSLACDCFREMSSLDLSMCKRLQDADLRVLSDARLPSLRALRLAGCRDIGDGGLAALLPGLRGLRTLDLSLCAISDGGVPFLLAMADLTELDLSGCARLTDVGARQLATHCERLISLSLEGCRDVSGWALAGAAPRLSHLALGGLTLVNDAGISAFCTTSRACASLLSLSLRQCRAIGDTALRTLGAHCKMLTSLDVSRCGAVTGAGLSALAEGCSQLSRFESEGYTDLADVGVIALAEKCTSLTHLNLWCAPARRLLCVPPRARASVPVSPCPLSAATWHRVCSALTDAAVTYLAAHCPRLDTLDIRLCTQAI